MEFTPEGVGSLAGEVEVTAVTCALKTVSPFKKRRTGGTEPWDRSGGQTGKALPMTCLGGVMRLCRILEVGLLPGPESTGMVLRGKPLAWRVGGGEPASPSSPASALTCAEQDMGCLIGRPSLPCGGLGFVQQQGSFQTGFAGGFGRGTFSFD